MVRPGPVPAALPEAPTLLVFCARGRVRVTAPGVQADLQEGDLLSLAGEGDGPVPAAAAGAGALVAVALHPR